MKSKEYTSYDLYEHILDNINQEFQFQKNQEYETLIEPDKGAKNKEVELDFKDKGKIILAFDPANFKKQKIDLEMFPIFSKEKSFPDYIIIPEPDDENTLFILHVELKSNKYNTEGYIYKFINSGKTLRWISDIMVNDLAKKINNSNFNFELFSNIKIIHRFIVIDSRRITDRIIEKKGEKYYPYEIKTELKIPILLIGNRQKLHINKFLNPEPSDAIYKIDNYTRIL